MPDRADPRGDAPGPARTRNGKDEPWHPTLEPTNPPDEIVRRVLADMRRVAVVGLSARPDRASYGVTRFLVGRGLEVVGVNPALQEDVLGLPIYAELDDVPGTGRRGRRVPAQRRGARRSSTRRSPIGARAVWLQEGVVHEEAAARARAAGLTVIQDRCLYKEWLRLLNG